MTWTVGLGSAWSGPAPCPCQGGCRQGDRVQDTPVNDSGPGLVEGKASAPSSLDDALTQARRAGDRELGR